MIRGSRITRISRPLKLLAIQKQWWNNERILLHKPHTRTIIIWPDTGWSINFIQYSHIYAEFEREREPNDNRCEYYKVSLNIQSVLIIWLSADVRAMLCNSLIISRWYSSGIWALWKKGATSSANLSQTEPREREEAGVCVHSWTLCHTPAWIVTVRFS